MIHGILVGKSVLNDIRGMLGLGEHKGYEAPIKPRSIPVYDCSSFLPPNALMIVHGKLIPLVWKEDLNEQGLMTMVEAAE